MEAFFLSIFPLSGSPDRYLATFEMELSVNCQFATIMVWRAVSNDDAFNTCV